jgi:hypothetical protein
MGEAVTAGTLSMSVHTTPASAPFQRLLRAITTTKFHPPPPPQHRQEGLSPGGSPGPDTESRGPRTRQQVCYPKWSDTRSLQHRRVRSLTQLYYCTGLDSSHSAPLACILNVHIFSHLQIPPIIPPPMYIPSETFFQLLDVISVVASLPTRHILTCLMTMPQRSSCVNPYTNGIQGPGRVTNRCFLGGQQVSASLRLPYCRIFERSRETVRDQLCGATDW